MCGVPVHAAEGYLLTLIRKGFRVAVCEQMEDPAEAKKRGSKSVVKRDVVRLVTPGTLTEESLLEARRHNFLAAFAEVRDDAALAWVDISTGEFRVMPCPPARLAPELARLAPREVVLSEAREADWAGTVTEAGAALTPLARASFDSTSAERRLCALFGVGSLEAFGSLHPGRDLGDGRDRRLPGADPEGQAAAAAPAGARKRQPGGADRRRDPAQPGTHREPVGRARRLAAGRDRPHRHRRRRAAAGASPLRPVARLDRDPRPPPRRAGSCSTSAGWRTACARRCARCRTSTGRSRVSRWTAAARATSRRSATG